MAVQIEPYIGDPVLYQFSSQDKTNFGLKRYSYPGIVVGEKEQEEPYMKWFDVVIFTEQGIFTKTQVLHSSTGLQENHIVLNKDLTLQKLLTFFNFDTSMLK